MPAPISLVRPLVFIAVLAGGGCGDPGSTSDGGTSDPTTGPSAGSSTSAASLTEGLTTGGADDDTGSTTSAASTGGARLCGIEPGAAPDFEITQDGVLVPMRDASVAVSCGPQGSFMFHFPLRIIGVDTMGAEEVPFSVTVDVGDYALEQGHFMARAPSIYVGCDWELEGEDVVEFNLVLPDALDEPTDLDGLPLSMTVVMLPGTGQEVTYAVEGAVDAQSGQGWDWCYSGGSGNVDDVGSSDSGSGSGSGTGTGTG